MNIVSVNIVTYNSRQYIKQCIECVYKQVYKKFSIVVIDNCSSDDTVSICKHFPLRIIQNSVNMGYAAAHNQGIGLTESKYVLTLNPDVFLRPKFLYQMVSVVEKDVHIGSACGLLLRTDHVSESPKIIDGAGLFMRKNRRQGLLYEGKPIRLTPQANYIFGPDGSAAFYRRTMLEDVAIHKEIFDEDFFMHKEDVDLAWRAQRAGWESVFVPKAIAVHIRTFRSGKRQVVPPTIQRISLRNRYLLLLKNDELKYFLRGNS